MDKQYKLEPVAVVMSGYALHFAGAGPIGPLCERTGVKVGSKLVSLEQAQAYIEREQEAIRNAALEDIIKQLSMSRDLAYIQYVEMCKHTLCLGEDEKLKRGIFGAEELKAHRIASGLLGEHKAFAEAVTRLLKSQPAQPPQDDGKIALDRLADHIADNWPDKKFALEEICQRLRAMWPAEFTPASLLVAQPCDIPWDNFPGYLIDHHEGQTISEEFIQFALADMLKDSKYTQPSDSQAEVPEDEDDLPVGYADWYNLHFARQTVDMNRFGDCEEAWRAAYKAAMRAQEGS